MENLIPCCSTGICGPLQDLAIFYIVSLYTVKLKSKYLVKDKFLIISGEENRKILVSKKMGFQGLLCYLEGNQ